MSDIIQLLGFKLTRLHLDQDPFDKSKADQPDRHETGYEILSNRDDPERFMMILRINGTPGVKKGQARKPTYDCEGVAEFTVPQELAPEKKYPLVAFNGGSIMYGLIRGQIAMVTGNFPSGSILLPALNWQETVREIEGKRERQQAEQRISSKTPPKKKTKKQRSPRTPKAKPAPKKAKPKKPVKKTSRKSVRSKTKK